MGRVQVRDVHEAINACLGSETGNCLRALHVDVLVGEVPVDANTEPARSARGVERPTWSRTPCRQGCTRYRSVADTHQSGQACEDPIPGACARMSGHLLAIPGAAAIYTHHGYNLPEIPSDLQVPFLVLVSVRDDDLRARLSCSTAPQFNTAVAAWLGSKVEAYRASLRHSDPKSPCSQTPSLRAPSLHSAPGVLVRWQPSTAER